MNITNVKKYTILYILGYTKMIKSDILYSEECTFQDYIICQILSFLCSLEYTVVYIESLHVCSSSLAISKILFCFFFKF
jgi:hypothetical protein